MDEYPINTKQILKTISEMQLPLVPCMTKSGGVHLFMFTKEPIPAFKFQNKLEEIAAAMGRTGDEIFLNNTNGQSSCLNKSKQETG